MSLNMLSVQIFRRPIVWRAAMGAAALASASSLSAQVIEVGDDGVVSVRSQPGITTNEGVTTLRPLQRGRAYKVVTRYAPANDALGLYRSAALDFGIDQRLLHAVAWQESRFRQTAVSPKGAVGVMQLMPATARSIGIDPTDPVQNVRGGALLLSRLLHEYGGNVSLALAAYNAGPGAVRRHGGMPPFAETRNYVSTIMHELDATIATDAVHLEKAL